MASSILRSSTRKRAANDDDHLPGDRNPREWAITVDGLPDVHTQAKRLDQVREVAREAIALTLDVPEKSIDVQTIPKLPRKLRSARTVARQLREEAELLADLAIEGAHVVVLDAERRGYHNAT